MKWNKSSETLPADTNQTLLCNTNVEWGPTFTTGWYHAEIGKWVSSNQAYKDWEYWTEIVPPSNYGLAED